MSSLKITIKIKRNQILLKVKLIKKFDDQNKIIKSFITKSKCTLYIYIYIFFPNANYLIFETLYIKTK